MNGNGQPRDAAADGVLRWTGRVVSAADLRHRLNGHRELELPARAVVTPLAAEELRARGVQLRRQAADSGPAAKAPTKQTWGYAQDRPHPLVGSAVAALGRDGLALQEVPAAKSDAPWQFAKAVAECVARGECLGGVIFCQDPGLVCCVANKLPGLRAATAASVAEAARAALTLVANLVAVEMPGRTFFEVRQILRTVCRPGAGACPPGLACTLGELDGHAHR